MIKAITKYLSEIGRKGGTGGKRGTKESMARKGFGSAPLSAEARAKALATRSANRSANRVRDEREALRQAVIRAQKKPLRLKAKSNHLPA
jgi:hypothetical protein